MNILFHKTDILLITITGTLYIMYLFGVGILYKDFIKIGRASCRERV